MTEKYYTTYEQTADKETSGKDTRSEHEWFLYYLLWVNNAEYPDFVTWLADMIKSGNLIEEEKEIKKMKGIKNFFEIRKEAKAEMAKINKNGFGYVNPKIIDILHKKGYSVSQYPEENGMYFVCTPGYFNEDVYKWCLNRWEKQKQKVIAKYNFL